MLVYVRDPSRDFTAMRSMPHRSGMLRFTSDQGQGMYADLTLR